MNGAKQDILHRSMTEKIRNVFLMRYVLKNGITGSIIGERY